MMRALVLLATIPSGSYANDEMIPPSCAHPADVEARAAGWVLRC